MTKTELQSARAAFLKAEADLSDLQNFKANHAEQQAGARAVLTVADLQDKARLGKISDLETIGNLLPLCEASLEAAAAAAGNNLIAATSAFITKTHGPRRRDLEARAEAIVRKNLAPHFTEAFDLDRAVSRAALVVEANGLGVSLTDSPAAGPLRYADGVLRAADRADELAKKLA
jgi:hypothetical protein